MKEELLYDTLLERGEKSGNYMYALNQEIKISLLMVESMLKNMKTYLQKHRVILIDSELI